MGIFEKEVKLIFLHFHSICHSSPIYVNRQFAVRVVLLMNIPCIYIPLYYVLLTNNFLLTNNKTRSVSADAVGTDHIPESVLQKPAFHLIRISNSSNSAQSPKDAQHLNSLPIRFFWLS